MDPSGSTQDAAAEAAVRAASGLLASTAAADQSQWAGFSKQELCMQVAALRSSIQATSAQLARLTSHGANPGSASDQEAADQPAATRAGDGDAGCGGSGGGCGNGGGGSGGDGNCGGRGGDGSGGGIDAAAARTPSPTDAEAGACPGNTSDGAAAAAADAAIALDAALATLDPLEWQVPPHCIPIHANVTTYDWQPLIQATQFDVIMMDPPWQLATANPTRGVALGYSQLTDADILNLPVPQLQQQGFLFVWVINAKYKFTLDLFEAWGYRLVDEIVWVKMTVNRRLAKSHGYYLQHAKEVCLVGQRGGGPLAARGGGDGSGGICSDVIFSERRGQSQKPEEIYELIEALVPEGRYLEIFARKNNLRNFWVSVGNEVTGTGLPEEDVAALQGAASRIPGAVYGRGGGGAAGGAAKVAAG